MSMKSVKVTRHGGPGDVKCLYNFPRIILTEIFTVMMFCSMFIGLGPTLTIGKVQETQDGALRSLYGDIPLSLLTVACPRSPYSTIICRGHRQAKLPQMFTHSHIAS